MAGLNPWGAAGGDAFAPAPVGIGLMCAVVGTRFLPGDAGHPLPGPPFTHPVSASFLSPGCHRAVQSCDIPFLSPLSPHQAVTTSLAPSSSWRGPCAACSCRTRSSPSSPPPSCSPRVQGVSGWGGGHDKTHRSQDQLAGGGGVSCQSWGELTPKCQRCFLGG